MKMNKLFFVLYILGFPLLMSAQEDPNTLKKRIIFIGDAGVKTPAQTALISDAASQVIPEKSTTVYLGNNIYPDGMELKEGKQKIEDEAVLKSQYQPMRDKDARVLFIPGNRDWDNSGARGLKKLNEQKEYIEAQNDTLLKMQPAEGCPGPEVTEISEDLLMITLDSEWWLHPYDRNDKEKSVCANTTEKEVETALRQILYHNKDKTILLVTHHPFESYGNYGGKYSWKDHIFPLTALNPNLYLPLPGVGSFYPLAKKALPNREDLDHPWYQEVKRMSSKVFRGFPNVVQISSHEDGLQHINNPENYVATQVVTGIGNKPPYVVAGEYSKFNASTPSYVVADWLADKSIHFSFYAYADGEVEKVHEFTQAYQDFESWDSPVYSPVTQDSMTVAIQPKYVKRGQLWRSLVGENYREAWATPAKLPVLQISEINGGLKMRKIGGGHQTRSLRLKDSTGVQYVLRGVEKIPDRVIPERFYSPFTREVVSDFYSSQHPYSALAVPPIAEAVGVPHTNPVIGYVAPDENLGIYEELFAGRVNLLEEWEPLRPTDNYRKGLTKLVHDNDNTFDADNFLKARMVDLIVGDWDRHYDQWRFHDRKEGKHKDYLIVPRDRDMAMNVTNGLLVSFGKYFFLKPHVYGFSGKLFSQVNQYLYKSDFLNAHPANQLNYGHYTDMVNQVHESLTDSVLTAAVNAMPKELNADKQKQSLNDLKERRDQLPAAMDKYYKFSNRIVDIRGTNSKEFISITSSEDENALHVFMRKINKHGKLRDTLMSKTYPRSMTKEIRLYLEEDRDSVYIDNTSSTIKLRIIGGQSRDDRHKSYHVKNSKNKVQIYDYEKEVYTGDIDQLKLNISKEPANTAYVPVNLYDDWIPIATAGFNRDDGFVLGLGAKFIQQRGFRKEPFAAEHSLMLSHAFTTKAFEINYKGDWTDVIGKANLTVDADIKAPENTDNFFGIGNEADYIKVGNHHSYYRARYNLYSLRTALKWEDEKGSTFSLGPAFQYYHYDPKDNNQRFIQDGPIKYTYDRDIIDKNKLHLGLVADYTLDSRNDDLLPTDGVYGHAKLSGYTGLNSYAKAFVNFKADISFYKSLNARKSIVLSNRLGGEVTGGHPAFYQHAYLGGGGNLLGYRQNRFAGKHALYNNLEMRLALANFGNMVFKGEIGLTGFYDVGRVWVPGEDSHKWHNGVGGGVYFAPAYSLLLNFQMGYADEGWYPYFSLGFRF